MLGIQHTFDPPQLHTPPATPQPPPGGKDIAMAKRTFEEEQRNLTPTGAKRKKNVEAVHLTKKTLTLFSSLGDETKRSRTILTKCKHDITVDTNKQYLTYELFAEMRKKSVGNYKGTKRHAS
ncbi:Hypothetical predicted protein [Paramuricea clavata]|uniref:Uncharacterized protein n=1 Tax=Paramuricea clavata TaxID=317549 RepID=A0A6S7HSH1_PARCT|nr:Hypothetical predicted protein [Paramuricea clavata]